MRSVLATSTILAFLLLTLLGVPLRAEIQPQILSWEDCVGLASQNNPALQSSTRNVAATEDTTLASRSGLFPQVSGALTYTYANAEIVTAGGTIIGGSQSSNSYTASLSASENLFNGLSDLAAMAQARARQEVAEEQLATEKASLSYSLKVAFEGLSYSKDALGLAKDIATRREQNLRLVELRFKDGQENKGSVLLYQAYLLDAKFGVLQAADNVDTAKIQLAQSLGMDSYKDLDIRGTIPATDPPIAADFEAIAVTTPSYLQAVHNAEAADAAVTIARSGFFPTLGVSGNALRSGETFFPQGNQWSLSVSLGIPLFNGGRDFFGTKSAIESRKAAELTFHDIAHQQVYSLQQAQTAFLEAVENLKVTIAYLEASKVRARIARTNYNNGITSFQDWDLSETDLITRQKNFIQAQQLRVTAQANWEQAQGKGAIP